MTNSQSRGLGTISTHNHRARSAENHCKVPQSRNGASAPCTVHGSREKKRSDADDSDPSTCAVEIRPFRTTTRAPEPTRVPKSGHRRTQRQSRTIDDGNRLPRGASPRPEDRHLEPLCMAIEMPDDNREASPSFQRLLTRAVASYSGPHRNAFQQHAKRTHRITAQIKRHNRAFAANSPHNRASPGPRRLTPPSTLRTHYITAHRPHPEHPPAPTSARTRKNPTRTPTPPRRIARELTT